MWLVETANRMSSQSFVYHAMKKRVMSKPICYSHVLSSCKDSPMMLIIPSYKLIASTKVKEKAGRGFVYTVSSLITCMVMCTFHSSSGMHAIKNLNNNVWIFRNSFEIKYSPPKITLVTYGICQINPLALRDNEFRISNLMLESYLPWHSPGHKFGINYWL